MRNGPGPGPHELVKWQGEFPGSSYVKSRPCPDELAKRQAHSSWNHDTMIQDPVLMNWQTDSILPNSVKIKNELNVSKFLILKIYFILECVKSTLRTF